MSHFEATNQYFRKAAQIMDLRARQQALLLMPHRELKYARVRREAVDRKVSLRTAAFPYSRLHGCDRPSRHGDRAAGSLT